jgi:GAF domain-containing protein/CheY-like chemotaxis protein
MVKDALRIAELEKKLAEQTAELIQRNEELGVIKSVQEALLTQKDLAAIYDLVGEKIRVLFDAQAVIISTFHHEAGLERFNYTIENGERFYPDERPINKLRRHLIDTGESIVINNSEEAIGWFGTEVVPGTKYMKSGIFVPLVSMELVTGYVSLQNVEKENAFSTSEIQLLQTLCNSMSSALQSARLLKETEQRTAELAVINSVQEGLAKELDIQAIYDLVGNRIRELFNAQVVGIATFDHQNQQEHIHFLIEKNERYYPVPKPLNTLRKHLIQTREKIVINKNFESVAEAFGMKPVPGTQAPKSAVYVPLVIGEKVTGYTSLQNIDQENAFGDSDIRLLETLANTMAVALENARLFDETTRLLKETEQQKAELGVINSVQEGLAKELDMQAIYDLVGDRIRELFNAQAVIIATLDHETATEHFKYLIEDGQRFYLASRPYDKLRQHLVMTRQKIVINRDYAGAYARFGLKTLPGTNMTKSGVFVPLVIGDKVNSYISLQNNEIENAFSESDVRLLETLANSMSVALENARLFDETNRLLKETEQRTAELAVINSVQEGLAKELDINSIYDLVGNKIREVFDAQAVIIATFDHELGTEKFNYLFENGQRFFAEPRRYDKLRYELIMKKQKILINENSEKAFAEFGLKAVAGTNYPKSMLFVPLILGNRVTSYVSLQNVDRENAFSPSDVRLLETLANSMSVALENARLFDETNRLLKETEQRNSELAVINKVQESLVAKMDIAAIYELVGEKIREIFDAQVVDIVTYDKETGLIEDRYAFEKGDRSLIGPRPANGFRKKVIEAKQMVLLNENVLQAAMENDNPVAMGDVAKSAIFLPMIAAGEVKGIISLQNLDHENAFSAADVNLITTLANSMSVALESARLFDETNRLLKETDQRNAELAVINSVQESLVAKMDMQGIYDLVGEKIRELFDAQVVDIVTYDPVSQIIEDRYAYEKGDRTLLGPRAVKGFREHVVKTKQVLVHNENVEQALLDFGNEVLIGEVPKSQVYVPMIAGGEVKGIISLQNVDHENAFSDSDINLITTLANSMSVALESARLFDETTRLLKETEQRTRELSVITSVQDGLAKELDIQGIYDLVGEKMREIFNAQVFDIATYDKTTGLIEDRYTYELGDRTLLPPRELIGFRKWVVESGKPLLINKDIETHTHEFGNVIMAGAASKSVVFVPIITGGEVTGVMSLQNLDEENAFSASDVRLLTTLGNSMTVALENARLFDETNRLLKETEQRTAELAVINSVQEGLAKELDIKGIYNLVGDRLCDLFPDTQTLVIRTFDHEKQMEHFQYALEKGEVLDVPPQPFMWASRILIETHKPIDIQKNYLEVAKKYGGKGVTTGKPPQSAIFVPMLVGDIVKGSVSLQNVDRESAFTEADQRLLTTITNSMSVALENARLFDETHRLLRETEQRTAELAVINSIQEGLVREMDIHAIYDLIGERLCDLFNTQTVLIRTFDHEENKEHWRYVIEKGERYYSEPRPIMWANRYLIDQKKPFLINNNYLETARKYGSPGVSMGSPPRSALFVPMLVGDVVRGSVSLQNVEIENAFSESDLRLLSTITNSMSVALENARLFNETTLLLSESKQRAAELSTVNNISKALASLLNPSDLIKMVGDQLRNLFNANIVYLAIHNKQTDIISFPYQHGDNMAPLKLGEGLTSKIISTGQPLLINKELNELRLQMGVQRIGIDAASYLGVPIPVGEEIIGVLSVQSTEQENRFNENDLRLLSTIAASVGVALRNATLFEDVKKAQREAEEASKAAEKANEAKSAFLSTVSHELRTPLTSVLGFAKIIRKRLDEKVFPLVAQTDPKLDKTISQITENLKVVVSEGERLTHLINDVLDLAKIEAGKMEWHKENLQMQEVAERAIASTTSLFENKDVQFRHYIQPNLPEISGDKDKLIQVIINLLSNAVKFTDKGTIECRVEHKDPNIVVSIKDSGIGIDKKDFNAVFEQFKQVGTDTLTDKPKGTGLGLPICKEIVEHHGGKIWLESKVGKGSTFYFSLPVKPAETEKSPVNLGDLVKHLNEQVAFAAPTLSAHSASILIVDDDDSIRFLLHQELSELGYTIREATNGKEALESVRAFRPELILLDIMMPEMNGFDVAAVLKNDPETMDIPIIVLSVVKDKARAFKIGVDRYLTKPIDTNLLFDEVGILLEQGKSKKKVMIVDEDANTLRMLTELLTAKGYDVSAASKEEVLHEAIKHQPEIIIMSNDMSSSDDLGQTLRFEKGLEKVLFVVYQ